MPCFVVFKDPQTGEIITSNPVITNLGEKDIIKIAKETLVEDGVATEEQLKSRTAEIRFESP
jgi:hypothetical protein